jgi:hypothetical protein
VAVPAAALALGWGDTLDVLSGGVAWLLCLLTALAGWGTVVERVCQVRTDLGLRLIWGAGALLAVAGVPLALGVLQRDTLVGLVALGLVSHAWHRFTEDDPALIVLIRRLRDLARDPQLLILWLVLAALTAIGILGAVARLHGNPFDDDIAYTPMVKRLLDAGNLDEPFSFRRLSALGGQTILQALGAARGTLANLFLVDHGVFRIISLALLVGLLRRDGRANPFTSGLIVLVFLLLPAAFINTASYFTGTAFFLGLYRTAVELPRIRGGFGILGGLAAATCSLRQNYLPVAVLFVFLVLAFRLRRPLAAAVRADGRSWLQAALAGAVVLLPFVIASWRSSQTLLYPLQLGTGNPNFPTMPTVWSVWQELQFFVQVILDPNPVRVMVPLLPVLLLCRDRRPGAPLIALAVACAVGFVLLVHSFTLSDARNLWRYAFGYMTVLALVLAAETVGTDRAASDSASADDADPVGSVRAPMIARLIVIVCLLAQFPYGLKTTLSNYRNLAADLHQARSLPITGRSEIAQLYRRLQHSVPAGAALVVLVDEPSYLDYRRNPISHLDTPGAASPRPGMPMFTGAEAKASYLRNQLRRYLAFVRGDHSRYFYRREYWLERIYWDVELWRMVAAYQLDLGDSLAELGQRYPVLFDEGGMVVIDLGSP